MWRGFGCSLPTVLKRKQRRRRRNILLGQQMTERGNPGFEVIRSVGCATRTMNLTRQAVGPFLPAEHTLLMKVNGHGKGLRLPGF